MISKASYQKYFKKEIESKYIYIQFAINNMDSIIIENQKN